jgi:uncharacterized protein YuzE
MTKPERLRVNLNLPTPPLGIEIERVGGTVMMYVRVLDSAVARTKEIDEDLLADYDKDGKLIGFEVVGMRPGMSGKILSQIREKYAAQVPSLELLRELMPA